jgi:hypothetical protein
MMYALRDYETSVGESLVARARDLLGREARRALALRFIGAIFGW